MGRCRSVMGEVRECDGEVQECDGEVWEKLLECDGGGCESGTPARLSQ